MKRNKHENIILVGFMGTGKTSVGKALANRLNLTFTDMDEVIQNRTGKPVSQIFAENGEPHFRALERNLVTELASKNGLVIATGGGIVLNPANIADFSMTGLVVCLSADPEAILRRVADDTTRPLLAGDDKLNKILGILEIRRPLYNAIPNKIDTTSLTIDQVVDQIIALHNKRVAADERR